MEGKNLIQKFRGLHPRFVLERTLHPTFVDANRQPRFAFYKSSHRASEIVDLQLHEDGNNAIFKFDDDSTHEIPTKLLMNSKLPGVQIPSFVMPNWIPISSHEWMLRKYEYDDLQNEDVQFDFLTSLYKYGMCVVEKFPDPMVNGAPFDLVKLLKTIVELRSTSWGDTFSVRSEPDGKKKDLAYTADAIPLHTDNPYRQLPPG